MEPTPFVNHSCMFWHHFSKVNSRLVWDLLAPVQECEPVLCRELFHLNPKCSETRLESGIGAGDAALCRYSLDLVVKGMDKGASQSCSFAVCRDGTSSEQIFLPKYRRGTRIGWILGWEMAVTQPQQLGAALPSPHPYGNAR